MREIRPIRTEEADTFLELLCGVFNLDLARAHSIFFTEPLFDLSRKWALFDSGEMVSILTTTPLWFGWGRAYGIAGVATRADRRGQGFASLLLERVFQEAGRMGEGASLLFARDPSVYQMNGYEPIDRVIRAKVASSEAPDLGLTLDNVQVRDVYDHWASLNPARLRRDEPRWRYWLWHYRLCSPFQEGYLCTEPGVLREALYSHPSPGLPLPFGTDWFGTASMTELLQMPLATEPKFELHLMGRNFRTPPQMFMTDQF